MAETRPATTAPEARSEPLDGTKVKPTPTQDENDRAALGEHVIDKEPDGSPPDPNVEAMQELHRREQERRPGREQRHASPQGGAPYQTRQARPEQARSEPHKPQG